MIEKTKKRTPIQAARKKGTELILDRQSEEEEGEGVEMSPFPFNPMALFGGQRDRQELEDRGVLVINHEISKQTLQQVCDRMLVLHFDPDFTDKIQLVLNSPGGYCDAGWALIDLISFVKNEVRTICMGEICSMATSIFIAGDERIMAPNSVAMIHQFSDGTEGSYKDLVARRKVEDMQMAMDVRHLIRCSKYKNETEVKKHLLKDYDNWMSPAEMKKHGLCDKIIKPKPRG